MYGLVSKEHSVNIHFTINIKISDTSAKMSIIVKKVGSNFKNRKPVLVRDTGLRTGTLSILPYQLTGSRSKKWTSA